MRKQVVIIVLLLLPLVASAYDAKIDGIYYEFTSTGTAKVTCFNMNTDENVKAYVGDVVIPGSVTHEGVDYSVTGIAQYAFFGCSNMTSITIPSSVTRIEEYAFLMCGELTAVHISDLAAWCNMLFDGVMANPLVYAHHLFLNGTEVKNLVIPGSVTSIADYAFLECSGLTSLTIPNGVTQIGFLAFQCCSGLTDVSIPNTVTHIRYNAFYGCTGLTSLTIPEGVTHIGNNAFGGCSGLTEVSIPSSVTLIGTAVFAGCNHLTAVSIPNSVTIIGTEAFKGCTALASVTLGTGVESINNWAFDNCSSLHDVYSYAKHVPTVKGSAFNSLMTKSITLHVPGTLINDYATASVWKTFKEYVSLGGDAFPMCAAPTIKVEGGKLIFSCPTDGATLHWTFNYANSNSPVTDDHEVVLDGTTNCIVNAWASKAGYANSIGTQANVALSVGMKGDVNGDGKVSISDAVGVVDMVMNAEPEKHWLYGEDPNFEPPIRVEQIYNSTILRFNDYEGDYLPTIPNEVYFGHKTIVVEVLEASPDCTATVMNGWWSTYYEENVPLTSGMKWRIQITDQMALECAQGGQGRDLTLMLTAGSCVIGAVYYEE